MTLLLTILFIVFIIFVILPLLPSLMMLFRGFGIGIALESFLWVVKTSFTLLTNWLAIIPTIIAVIIVYYFFFS